MQLHASRCDCCGLPIPGSEDECPRCGYPVELSKEKQYLRGTIRNLARVATHGGAAITVTDLLSRYQRRLDYLVGVEAQANAQAQNVSRPTAVLPQFVAASVRPLEPKRPAVPVPSSPAVPTNQPLTPVVSAVPQQTFSFHAFFADQSINIVASLGAFLILVGSLSFIASTSDALLALLVLLGVHIFFGATGAITFRFSSMRTVSIIYTAIFALQIPLVGFSFYRLVSRAQLSPSTLIAISAAYATLAYSSLAIYQRFKPFGYLGAVALAVTDLAIASALSLSLWWWPSAFLLLAFPMLYFVTRPTGPKVGNERLEILRQPGLALMYTAIIGPLCLGGLLYLIELLVTQHWHNTTDIEMRLSLTIFVLFLLAWVCLFIWRSLRYSLSRLVPYLFLAFVFCLLYTFQAATPVYMLVMTLVAILYWAGARNIAQRSWPIKFVSIQLDILIVALVVLTAFISDPNLIIEALKQAYIPHVSFISSFIVDSWLPLKLLLLAIGCAVLFGVVLNHVGWRRVPGHAVARWCWLLLLAGLVFHLVLINILLWTQGSLGWGLSAFAIGCAVAAAFVRRQTSEAWSYPLAILALWIACESMVLSFGLPAQQLILLLLLYVVSSYALLFYLKLDSWLWLPVAFAVISLFALRQQPLPFLLLGLAIPLLAASLTRWEKLPQQSVLAHGQANHTWPLYVMGLLYSVAFALFNYNAPQGTLETWFSLPGLFTIEMALLALSWYAAAVIVREVWPLGVATGFALLNVLMPTNQFWWLLGVAIGALLLAVLISRLFDLKWAFPWYIVAISAAFVMGIQGGAQGWSQAASWSLLCFALLVYLAGIAERNEISQLILFWTFTVLSCWAVYAAGSVGDLYRPPLLTLLFAGIGVGIRCVRFGLEEGTAWQRRLRMRSVLPLYTTATFGATLTGVQGWLNGVNAPFYAAVPVLLFVFALTAYGISLIERRSVGLWLVALFAFWGMLLLPTIVTCGSTIILPAIGQLNCQMQIQLVLFSLASSVLLCCVLGIVVLRLLKLLSGHSIQHWGWIWYIIALGGTVISCFWAESQRVALPLPLLLLTVGMFVALAALIMLVERLPELIIMVTLLAAWTVLHFATTQWNQLGILSIFFCLVFAAQFIWRWLAPRTQIIAADRLTRTVALFGQLLVVASAFVIMVNDGQASHIGAATLLIFAGLVFWWGQLQAESTQRHLARYAGGFLCALAVSWELHTLGQTELTILCTTPAVYLIVIAPFMNREVQIEEHQLLGQICSIVGATLLFGPTLWLSFQRANVGPSLLLAGESIILLLLGFITRIRFFVLSSAALVIITAIHVLFLPSLGIPTFLALFLLGILLVILATTLLLVRPRLAAFWANAG
ncbi:hypothetical protein [Dictyobacter kobayashii]|uniref:Uncharacterized protein n=1 Tax=Dictyobacter kobayashii TaxID=2014872 RepID=A0A402ACN4_9CHLR|nr:hypothetical protein [Dictyobacter kobayashii]GCE16853.1 hypothetical protein KDK_06530 [Dictyobacter kobayashii]